MKITCQVMIGKVILEPSEREVMVWMYKSDDGVTNSGEGMEIEEAKLEPLLEKFYEENF